jgi:ABC-2 type transport system ATP-binding protein
MRKLTVALRSQAGVLRADATDHAVVVTVPHAAEALAGVVAKAGEVGLKIRSLAIEEPNLEAVFLNLTGRALRD